MNMEIYNRNIEKLKERYEKVVEYIESEENEDPYEEDFNVNVITVNDKYILQVKREGKKYNLGTPYNESTLANMWFNGLKEKWELNCKLIMYGLGNGMYVREYLKSARKDCSIVVHEPSGKIFKEALKYFDMTDIFENPRFRLVFWPIHSEGNYINYYCGNIIEFVDVNTIKLCYHLNYPRIFTDNVEEFGNGYAYTLMYVRTNQRVYDRFGHDYNRNLFNNIKYFPDSYSFDDLVERIPEGLTAFVVAAGPSLDKNIKELHRAVGRSIIIATDTSLRPLAREGIKPDIAIILDGKKDKKYLSEESSRRIPLVCTLHAGSSFLDLHEGKKFFINTFCNHIDELCKKIDVQFPKLETGGSVANSAFAMARKFKCKTIVFVGQDLAYTDDKTHSVVTVRGEKETAVEDLEHVLWDVDIYGNKIRSSGEFLIYKRWFEEQIEKYPELNVIDATEGGVLIKGSTVKTLRETIEEECKQEIEFSKLIDSVKSLFNDKQKKEICKLLLEVPEELSRIKRLSMESSIYYSKMLKLARENKYRSSEMRKLFNDCDKNKEKIEELDVIEYVNNQLQEKISAVYNEISKLEDDEQTELITSCSIGKKGVDDIVNAIDEMAPYMTQLKENINRFI